MQLPAPDLGKGNGPINLFYGLDIEKPRGLKEQKKLDSPLQSTMRTVLGRV